jgi:Yip1-like protein
MAVRAEPRAESQKDWWLRTLAVLQSPQAVFAALKDESEDAVENRQEPVTALVYLGGIAGVLLAPAFGHLKRDYSLDALNIGVIVVFAGAVYGFFGYWLIGWTLSRGIKAMGGSARAHLCRHVLAYSLSPLVLSLVLVWPVRLALYGGDLFKDGGSDSSPAGRALYWLCVALAAWSVGLLVVGVRVVERWPWWRAVAASFVAVALAGLVLALWSVIA